MPPKKAIIKTPKTTPLAQKLEASPERSLHERITKRAHEIYLQGSAQGPLEDWFQAEREILREENQMKQKSD